MMVTHDFNEALYLADRIGVMRQGRMEQIGTTEDVFLRPATPFVAEFVGMKNIFEVALSGQQAVFGGLNLPMAEPGGDKRGVLAIRPEDIVLQREDGFEGGFVRYAGVIEQIVPAGLWHEVSVRCQQALFKTVIDRKTVLSQGYGEGDAVFLGFDKDAARVF